MRNLRALGWALFVVAALGGLFVVGWIVVPLFAVLYAGAELATGELWSEGQGRAARATSLLGWAVVLVVTLLGLLTIGWITFPAVCGVVLVSGELHTALRGRVLRAAG